LKQLVQATADDPKDANALFNLGMIRWQGEKKMQKVRSRPGDNC